MQNFAVGLAHTFAGQHADVAYRLLNALRDKAYEGNKHRVVMI